MTGTYCEDGIDREFFWTGTRDHSTYISIEAAFEYIDNIGKERIYKHNHELAVEAGKTMAKIWNTKVLTEDESLIGFINNVEVPTDGHSYDKCVRLAFYMLQWENCFPVLYEMDGKVYIRISVQIFNEIGDYEWSAKRIREVLNSKEYD